MLDVTQSVACCRFMLERKLKFSSCCCFSSYAVKSAKEEGSASKIQSRHSGTTLGHWVFSLQ